MTEGKSLDPRDVAQLNLRKERISTSANTKSGRMRLYTKLDLYLTLN